MSKSARIAIGAGLLVAAVLVYRHGHRNAEPPAAPAADDQTAEAPAQAPSEPAVPTPRAPAPSPAPPPRRVQAAPPTEASLMATLRELDGPEPERALALAREGNRRFPNSDDAAERGSTICKSLAALGRFDEAQDEARRMVNLYPNTSWAADVQRHLLTQPLTDPSQRGFGKKSELE